MVSILIQSFTFVVNNVSSWMYEIFDSTGAIMIYLGAIAVVGCIRLILRPYFGRPLVRGSDYATISNVKR